MTDVFLNKLSLQIDRKWMAVSFDKFYGKIWLGFCLTQENAYSQRFHFKANTKSGSKATAPEANYPILFSPTLKLTLTLTGVGGGWQFYSEGIARIPEEHRFLLKIVLGIFKIALRLRDQHIFLYDSHWKFGTFSLL